MFFQTNTSNSSACRQNKPTIHDFIILSHLTTVFVNTFLHFLESPYSRPRPPAVQSAAGVFISELYAVYLQGLIRPVGAKIGARSVLRHRRTTAGRSTGAYQGTLYRAAASCRAKPGCLSAGNAVRGVFPLKPYSTLSIDGSVFLTRFKAKKVLSVCAGFNRFCKYFSS